jgi:hypothetical protein
MNEMNTLNGLEERMRSWRPRRPSPGLDRWRQKAGFAADQSRCADTGTPGRGAPFLWPHFARALAPAAACLLLTAAILMQPGRDVIVPGCDPQTMVVAALSNQNYAAYLPGSYQPAANRLDTFRWTNEGRSPSSMRSQTPFKAMDLQ